MNRYIVIDEDSIITGIMETSATIEDETMIKVEDGINVMTGQRYNSETGEVEDVEEEDEISEKEIVQAEILLNQLEIQEKLEEQEVVLAEILLNSLGGE